MQKLPPLALALALVVCSAAADDAGRITDQVREVTLANGLRLLLVQRPGQPKIAAGWVARVGSANERPGITGISHLFEHMMFKGSPRIGTRDAELDDELRAQLDDVRSQMFALERGFRERVRLGAAESVDAAAQGNEQMAELKVRFQELLEAQRDNLVKDEFDQIYTQAGATGMNAFTNEDMTVYFINVPRNKLELWFWMESERLAQPVFREFYSERDVVFEERRMRTDSTPTGAHDEVFDALFWRGHPYGWPTVGWPSDIAAITRQQAEDYFDAYYAPNNLMLALVGDFDEDVAVEYANRYFGPIPAPDSEPPDVITLSMPLLGQITYEASVDAPPSSEILYPTVAFGGDDDPALQVLAGALSGDTGRLYKRLVLKDQIATGVRASANSLKYDGSFSVSASGKTDVSPARLRDVMLEELDLIKRNGISEYELDKVRNLLVADRYRRLRDPFFVLIQLLYFEGLRSWQMMDSYYDRVLEVTREEVQAVANRYLIDDNRATKLYTRDEASEPEDPALAAFSPEQKQMVEALMGQLGAIPTDQIEAAIGQLEAMRAQAPPEAQAAVDYVIESLRARAEEG